MSLAPATRLGPYEVLAPIGAGGMGEVYRARDTRLGREVAVKVLPMEVAADPERLKRFEREARSASSLSHPNIVTIYDVGSDGGVAYMAMERVDGATLREILMGGLLPLKKLLALATQAAEGLSKAHEAGIVHRDLKPENLMVTKDGLVKILDFGLAKEVSRASGAGATQIPTVTGTTPGIVVGTVGYMSPEQAMGGPVGFRSDQFSLGSILYEMTTGRRAFHRKTAIDTLAAIMNDEPEPIARINPQAPAPLRWIVERCLAKDEAERYASTTDLARDLASLRDHASEISRATVEAAPSRRSRSRSATVGLLIAALAISAVFWVRRYPRPAPHPVFRQLTFRRGAIGFARFAADGQTVVYAAQWEGRPLEIFTTRIGSHEARSLGLTSANVLSVSSTGETAILTGPSPFLGTLSRVSLGGVAPRELLENVMCADWSPDGRDLAVIRKIPGRGHERRRLEYPIGNLLLESPDIWWPRVSPAGDQIAILRDGRIAVLDRAGAQRRRLGEVEATAVSWHGPNEIWFASAVQSGSEIRSLSLSGEQRLLATLPGPQLLQDVLPDGRSLLERDFESWEMVGGTAGETRERSLSWFDRSQIADLSTDGTTVVFNEEGAGAAGSDENVYIRKADGTAAVRLGQGTGAALSPDGKWVLATLSESDILLLPTGPGEARRLSAKPLRIQDGGAFFPNGRQLLMIGSEVGHEPRLYAIGVEGGAPRALTPEGVSMSVPGNPISPDGNWIAASGRNGAISLYSASGADDSARVVPGATGRVLRWTPDGASILVREFLATPTRQESVFRIDTRSGRKELWKTLAPAEPLGSGGIFGIVIAPDGRSYAYTYQRYFSDLVLVEGLR